MNRPKQQETNEYDSIIIGAGHNGLVCAAYLAKSGKRVLVLEAADTSGGLAASREFHPGFHASVAHSLSHFSSKVASDLKLSEYGYAATSKTLATIGLRTEKEPVVVHAGSLDGVSAADAASYQEFTRLTQRFAKLLQPFWLKTIPRIANASLSETLTMGRLGLNMRMLGKKDMREFMRIATLPARDLMDEFFDDDLLKAVLSWDGLVGSERAPRSPNGAVLALLYRMGGESRGEHRVPTGGVSGLIDALSASATALGAEIRCSSPVSRVVIDGNADGLIATGVELADGEKLAADRIISATDPQRTFLKLVGVEHLEIGFTNRIRRLRCNGYVAKLHLALNDLPEFNGLKQHDGRMIIAPDMDTMEFAFDAAKYGECPTRPVMEVLIPSVHDAALAPDGQHVLSAHVMYVPHEMQGGWTDDARDLMCERAIDTLAEYAPRIREQIIHREFLTPQDLEKDYRVTGGHWHHAEFALDQMLMMRPTYEAAQYSTPIPGLYLCGAGCHPGGDITGAAGHNAASEILR
ncbi:MAG: FAD-dependent oxidoreductase [Gammaproteobacteria bacterium]|nr:FAD-dependent oxidoreductase [Gammaproteobacteria bacterium]